MNTFDELINWYKRISGQGKNEVIQIFDLKSKRDVVIETGKVRQRPPLSDNVLSDINSQLSKYVVQEDLISFGFDVSKESYYKRLVSLYSKKVDDDFKYDYGIDIQTLDNPGWGLSVYLRGTGLQNKPIDKIRKENGGDDWIECKIENDVFKSYCDPFKLEESLSIFLEWAEPSHDFDTAESSEIFKWLYQWYSSYCDGDWEHCYGIAIKTLDNPGWLVDIELEDTDLEDKEYNEVFFKNSDSDWLECRVEGNVFKGRCSLDNLEKTISMFKEWVESNS